MLQSTLGSKGTERAMLQSLGSCFDLSGLTLNLDAAGLRQLQTSFRIWVVLALIFKLFKPIQQLFGGVGGPVPCKNGRHGNNAKRASGQVMSSICRAKNGVTSITKTIKSIETEIDFFPVILILMCMDNL